MLSQEGQHFEYININIYPREMAKRKLETVKFLFDGLFFFLFLLFQNKKHCLN